MKTFWDALLIVWLSYLGIKSFIRSETEDLNWLFFSLGLLFCSLAISLLIETIKKKDI